mgnify:CR=1 FL=1
MYVFTSSDWDLALHEFTDLLVKLLGKDLVMVVGLDESASVRDSNVLVVVDKVTEGVRRELIRAELEVNDKHDCTISYYVVGEGEGDVIREFERVGEKIRG